MVQLRENEAKYRKKNIPIVIITGQKKEPVQKWLEKNPMPFPFLIDAEKKVIKEFDVYNPLSIDSFRIAYPSLFLISADQEVVYAYVGKNQFDRPEEEAVYQQVHQLLADTLEE